MGIRYGQGVNVLCSFELNGQNVSVSGQPKFFVIEESGDAIIHSYDMPKITGYNNYRISFTLNSGNGFDIGNHYNVMISGFYEGNTLINSVLNFNVDQKEVDDFGMIASPNYYSRTSVIINPTGQSNRYITTWFKDASPISGNISSPTLRVYDRTAGVDILPVVTMSNLGPTGAYGYESDGINRIAGGEGHVFENTAVIDGATRTFRGFISRDIY